MALAFALPAREAQVVERVALACSAGTFLLAALEGANGLARVLGARVPDALFVGEPAILLLILPMTTLLLAVALLLTGSLPPERRIPMTAALGVFVVALVLFPVPIRALPSAWQTEQAYRLLSALPLPLVGLSLALATPRRWRPLALGGVAALVLHEVLAWGALDLMLGGDPLPAAWRVAQGGALVAGLALVAAGLGAAAWPPSRADVT